MFRILRCSKRSGCFRTSSPPPHPPILNAARRRKLLPVPSEKRSMTTPFLLRTDGLSLWAGMCIMSEGLRCLVPAPPEGGTPWPVSSSWQCQSARSSNNGWLSQRGRGAAATAPTIFDKPLYLQFFSNSQKKRNSWRVTCFRAPKMHVERSRGLLKTCPSQLGMRRGKSGFTAWQRAQLLTELSLKKNGVIFWCLSGESSQ